MRYVIGIFYEEPAVLGAKKGRLLFSLPWYSARLVQLFCRVAGRGL